MATQITNYQCPACTGPLHYSGESGKLVCDYCGSAYTPSEIEQMYAEKEQAAEAAAARQNRPKRERCGPIPRLPGCACTAVPPAEQN